jgi:SAM-dependent methyltransferase
LHQSEKYHKAACENRTRPSHPASTFPGDVRRTKDFRPVPGDGKINRCELFDRWPPITSRKESKMSNIPNQETFASMYRGKAPWDIGRPQKVFVEIADQMIGSVLDAGCGTGENALFFAGRGRPVVGIDYLEFPIREAQRKTKERGLSAEFIVRDALTLTGFERTFESVIDSGLFHVFADEDRLKYVAGLTHVTKPGGRVFLMCFSDAEQGTDGPRRVSERELRDAFRKGWTVEVIRPVRFEVIPDLQGMTFSEGGPKAWLAIVRRDA